MKAAPAISNLRRAGDGGSLILWRECLHYAFTSVPVFSRSSWCFLSWMLLAVPGNAQEMEDQVKVYAGVVLEVSGGIVWFRDAPTNQPIQLSSQNGRGKLIYSSSDLRCEPGARIHVQLRWAGGRTNYSGTNWFRIPCVQFDRRKTIIPDLERAGQQASFSPADGVSGLKSGGEMAVFLESDSFRPNGNTTLIVAAGVSPQDFRRQNSIILGLVAGALLGSESRPGVESLPTPDYVRIPGPRHVGMMPGKMRITSPYDIPDPQQMALRSCLSAREVAIGSLEKNPPDYRAALTALEMWDAKLVSLKWDDLQTKAEFRTTLQLAVEKTKDCIRDSALELIRDTQAQLWTTNLYWLRE